MKHILSFCLSVIFCLNAFAQKDTVVKSFGSITADDFNPTEIEKSGAYDAVVLLNQRVSTFNVYEHQVMFFNTFHIRYKALVDNFLDSNQIVVPFSGRYDYEKVLNTKARIYRLANQKVSEHKIKYKNIEVINRDSLRSFLVIHFPEIKAGDIVDVQYTKVSFNYSQPEAWNFHCKYPCIVSQAVTDFPDFIEYDFCVTGDYLPVDRSTNYHFQTITENFSSLNGPVNAYSERGEMITFRFSSIQNVFTAHNTMPVDTSLAFMPQKRYYDALLLMRPTRITEDIHQSQYLTAVWGRLTRLIFAYDEPGNRYLSKYEVWNQIVNPGYIKFESNNWARFTKELRKSSSFWKPILKSFVLNDKLSDIYDNADAVDSLTVVKQLYSYVTSNVKWDSVYSSYIERTPEMVLKQGVGNSAEINATLVTLLRRAGFYALPVLSATRDYGTVDSLYVNRLQFNNILAFVSFVYDNTQQSFILDAANGNNQLGALNKQNINNQYLVMETDNHFFVSLQQSFPDTLQLTAHLSNGKCQITHYASGLFVEEKHIRDSTFSFVSNNLHSVFNLLMGANPFSEIVRTVPVDFVVPRHYTYKVVCSQQLSNDFTPRSFSSVGERLHADFSVGEDNGQTVYQIDVNISSPFFELSAYDELRDFFAKVYSAAE